ncbi:MAG: hypothetical protein IPL86_13270 [Flavobacteriales bacterium]|nr:hypothetical protein [Flavobacteriales bacterium]
MATPRPATGSPDVRVGFDLTKQLKASFIVKQFQQRSLRDRQLSLGLTNFQVTEVRGKDI